MGSRELADVVVEFDSETGTYRASYARDADSPGLALVEAVAAIEETDPLALKPLGYTLDVDALNAVMRSAVDDADTRLSLSYHGYRVSIGPGETIELEPVDSDVAGE